MPAPAGAVRRSEPPIDGLALRDAIVAHLPRQCVLSLDTRMRYQLAAGPLLALLGMNASDIVGKTVVEVLGEDDGAEMVTRYRTALAGTEVSFDREFRDFYLEQTISPMYLPGRDKVVGVIAVIRDRSHRRRNELHLEALAETDALTLLDNRRAYERKLSGQLRLPHVHRAALRRLRRRGRGDVAGRRTGHSRGPARRRLQDVRGQAEAERRGQVSAGAITSPSAGSPGPS